MNIDKDYEKYRGPKGHSDEDLKIDKNCLYGKMNIDKDIEILKEKIKALNLHILNYKKSECETSFCQTLIKERDALVNVLSELETYKKKVDILENKVHYKICESCNKEYRTKRSDTKYCRECAKKYNSNWYSSLTEDKKQERREKSKLAMRKYRARKEVEK